MVIGLAPDSKLDWHLLVNQTGCQIGDRTNGQTSTNLAIGLAIEPMTGLAIGSIIGSGAGLEARLAVGLMVELVVGPAIGLALT